MATEYRFRVEEFERLYEDVKNIELLEGESYRPGEAVECMGERLEWW